MPSKTRYDNIAILLHWAIALLILGNIVLGHVMVALPAQYKPTLVPIHIWTGLLVLVLSLGRVYWRLTHPKPAYPAGLKPWEVKLAGITQFLLYLLMLGLPIIGFLILSANPPNPRMALHFLGIVPIPFVEPLQTMDAAPQKILHDDFVSAHALGAWLLVACLLLHLAGVAKHYLIDKMNLLKRMAPERLG